MGNMGNARVALLSVQWKAREESVPVDRLVPIHISDVVVNLAHMNMGD